MEKFLAKDTLPSLLPQVNRSDITLIEKKKTFTKKKSCDCSKNSIFQEISNFLKILQRKNRQ